MRKIKILVVDDDVDICDYMQLVLSQKRYDVTTQSDPTKVLDELKKDEFHVVILDLMMPEINGLELLEEIRGFDRDIAIIIFTGYPSVDTALMSLRYKVDDYIRKPFDIEAFNDSLERILREKGLLIDPEEELLITIGQNIRQSRKEQSLTLKQMSRRTGLSVSLLSQIERAESSASVSSLFKLATALDCRVTDFFGSY